MASGGIARATTSHTTRTTSLSAKFMVIKVRMAVVLATQENSQLKQPVKLWV